MTVSSRTPEGEPLRCPVCLREAAIELSDPPGDACCPQCGHLLWRVRDKLSRALNTDACVISLESRLAELGAESLDVVELAMELEEEFDVDIPDDVAERFNSVEDVVRALLSLRRVDPTL